MAQGDLSVGERLMRASVDAAASGDARGGPAMVCVLLHRVQAPESTFTTYADLPLEERQKRWERDKVRPRRTAVQRISIFTFETNYPLSCIPCVFRESIIRIWRPRYSPLFKATVQQQGICNLTLLFCFVLVLTSQNLTIKMLPAH